MKKFSDFKIVKPIKGINESEEIQANLPEETKDEVGDFDKLSPISKFISRLFESREMTHIYHLQVRGDEGSYAAHMALGGYYEGVLEFIDDLIEVYQGQYNIIEGYDVIVTRDTNTKDKLEYLKELADFIKTERNCISEEDTHLHNIVDEIVALLYKTIYKLKFNK